MRLLLVVLLAVACAACASIGAVNRPNVSAGRAFLERSCAGCHGIGLMDRSPDPHAPTLRRLALTRSDQALARALEEVSAKGHIDMPPVYVTPEERRQVLIYLHALRGGAGGALSPPRRGGRRT